MKSYLLLFPVCLVAQVNSLDRITGSWINENHQTRSVTQVIVRPEGNRTLVHAWARCHPIDCDWGEADAELWNGVPLAIWNSGPMIERLQLVPQPDGRLVVVSKTEFRDQSGRNDPGRAEFFVRESQQKRDPDDAEAKALLKKTAETYGNLRNARLESTETVERAGHKSALRTTHRSTALVAQPDRLHIETTGGSEPGILIADGQTLWQVYPQANEFTRLPQGRGPIFSSPLALYALLDQIRGSAKITARERFLGTECTVVRIEHERGVTQMLWIDDTTHLIRKETCDEPPEDADGSNVKRETVYSIAQTGVSVSPEFFTYDPAKTSAKDRGQLQRQASADLKGKPAPEFALHDLDGREVRLIELRGKAVLLDFWATWCGPCRDSLPVIELLHRSFRGKDLAVFGVDDESPEIGREFMQKYGYTLPSLFDGDKVAATNYHVGGIPTTVLIDREGKVAFYEVGPSHEQLRDALRSVGVW